MVLQIYQLCCFLIRVGLFLSKKISPLPHICLQYHYYLLNLSCSYGETDRCTSIRNNVEIKKKRTSWLTWPWDSFNTLFKDFPWQGRMIFFKKKSRVEVRSVINVYSVLTPDNHVFDKKSRIHSYIESTISKSCRLHAGKTNSEDNRNFTRLKAERYSPEFAFKTHLGIKVRSKVKCMTEISLHKWNFKVNEWFNKFLTVHKSFKSQQ